MKSALILSIALTTFGSTFAQGQDTWAPIPDKDSVELLSPSANHQISNEDVSVLVWNVLKGERKPQIANDLRLLTTQKEIVVLQEGMQDSYMPSMLASLNPFGWLMAKSFYTSGTKDATGVINGAVQDPLSFIYQRTVDTEPFANTPKVTLFSTYQLTGGSRLLVVNIHGINFTSLAPYQRQLHAIRDILVAWRGKIIFAGDFNTWNAGRSDIMMGVAKAAGLTKIGFNPDPRSLILDHIFVRGCQAKSSRVHGEIQSSDHKPLSVELTCPEEI